MSQSGVTRFPVDGTVSFDNLMDLRRRGEQAIAEADGELVFDLGRLEHANSAAVALLMAWFREAERHDQRIRFVAVPQELRSILELSGMTGVLPLEQTEDDAVHESKL